MPRFPRAEPEIAALTLVVTQGLGQAAEDFPTPPTHPGEMLREEFLIPLEMSQMELAKRTRVSYPRVNEIINGKRGITPDTALRLALLFGTSAEFWLNGQPTGICGTQCVRRTQRRFAESSRLRLDVTQRCNPAQPAVGLTQSSLSATIGSTRAARHAGRAPAASAARASRALA